jgi:hypothetical protein
MTSTYYEIFYLINGLDANDTYLLRNFYLIDGLDTDLLRNLYLIDGLDVCFGLNVLRSWILVESVACAEWGFREAVEGFRRCM